MRRPRVLLFSTLAGIVLYSALAWPTGHFERAVWPFHKSWFMFGRASGYRMHLETHGQLESGETVEIALDRWFRMPGSPAGRRYDEVRRVKPNLQKLAQFVCRKFNAEAVLGRRLRSVRFADRLWKIERGRAPEMAPDGGVLKPRLGTTYCLDLLSDGDEDG